MNAVSDQRPGARRVVSTEKAPAAIGPYSQAIIANGMVYTSGQIALDPASGEIVEGGVVAETQQVMKNLGAVLNAAGASFDSVVKTTIYLRDMADFAAVNEVYAQSFQVEPPARATVAVRGLPKGVAVEVDAVALLTTDSEGAR